MRRARWAGAWALYALGWAAYVLMGLPFGDRVYPLYNRLMRASVDVQDGDCGPWVKEGDG